MRTYRTDENAAQGLQDLIDTIPETYKGCMVEVGSSSGESAVVFAAAFDSVFCVDPWKDAQPYYDAFLERTKGVTNIAHRRTDSLTAAAQVDDETLDFVYVDARHTAPHPENDLRAWLPKVKHGGYIGGHDYEPRKFPGVVQAVSSVLGDRRVWIFKDTSWLVRVI